MEARTEDVLSLISAWKRSRLKREVGALRNNFGLSLLLAILFGEFEVAEALLTMSGVEPQTTWPIPIELSPLEFSDGQMSPRDLAEKNFHSSALITDGIGRVMPIGALHLAAATHQPKMIRLLLRKASPWRDRLLREDFFTKTGNPMFCLARPAWTKFTGRMNRGAMLQTLQELRDGGLSMHCQDERGDTLLHRAAALDKRYASASIAIVQYLMGIEAADKLRVMRNHHEELALHIAAKRDGSEIVTMLLRSAQPAQVTAHDSSGATALYRAVEMRHPNYEAVAALLAAGSQSDIVCRVNGDTPYLRAQAHGKLKLLLLFQDDPEKLYKAHELDFDRSSVATSRPATERTVSTSMR